MRKPREYTAHGPGEIVQIDTSIVSSFPGFRFIHFTAWEIFTRWHVVEAYSRANPHTAADFLDAVLRPMPFPVHASQRR